MEFDISIEGLEELFKIYGTLAGNEILMAPMNKSLFLLQTYMATYPALRNPNGISHRDGTLGRKWTTNVESDSDGLVGTLGNDTPYGPFVQSQMFQARMHRGWWQTDEDAFRVNKDTITKFFDDAVQKAIDEQ